MKIKGGTGFSFSFIIIQKEGTNDFYGMVREIDGLIVKGSSEEEVIEKINNGIIAIINAKKKNSTAEQVISKKPDLKIVREFQQNYQPC